MTVGERMRHGILPMNTKRGVVPTNIKRFIVPLSVEKLASYMLSSYRYQVSSRGMEYKDDECILQNINTVAAWLTTASEKCGFMFSGNVGNGKTTLMRAVQQTLNWLRYADITPQYMGMRIISAKEISTNMHIPDNFDVVCRYDGLAIDDLGAESKEEMSYGSVRTPVIDLLERRYDRQLFTVVTTNLTKEERRQKYGTRLYDRFQEMFVNVVFNSDSFRR